MLNVSGPACAGVKTKIAGFADRELLGRSAFVSKTRRQIASVLGDGRPCQYVRAFRKRDDEVLPAERKNGEA